MCRTRFDIKIRLPLFALMLCICACTQQSTTTQNALTHLSPEEAQALLNTQGEDLFVLDVRTPGEVASGHLPQMDGTANWHEWTTSFPQVSSQLDKTQPVLVYCRSGGRSNKAAEWLVNQGYSNVYNLDGGITKWQASGLPVVQPKEN